MDGGDPHISYLDWASQSLKYTIGTFGTPTTLSIGVNPTSPLPNQRVDIYGLLNTTSGVTRLANQQLYLEQSTDGGATWTPATTTPATSVNGAYTFLAPFKQPGTYLVRTHFNGTMQYGESWSGS